MKTPARGALLHARNVINNRSWEMDRQVREGRIDPRATPEDFREAIQELDDVSNWLAKIAGSDASVCTGCGLTMAVPDRDRGWICHACKAINRP